MKRIAPMSLALLLVGCAGAVNDVGGVSLLELGRYYGARAFEKGATCTSPEIRGVFAAELVEDRGEEGAVYAVRYAWRDRNVEDDDLFGVFQRCSGSSERRFTVQTRDGAPRIVEMSGPQRARR